MIFPKCGEYEQQELDRVVKRERTTDRDCDVLGIILAVEKARRLIEVNQRLTEAHVGRRDLCGCFAGGV